MRVLKRKKIVSESAMTAGSVLTPDNTGNTESAFSSDSYAKGDYRKPSILGGGLQPARRKRFEEDSEEVSDKKSKKKSEDNIIAITLTPEEKEEHDIIADKEQISPLIAVGMVMDKYHPEVPYTSEDVYEYYTTSI